MPLRSRLLALCASVLVACSPADDQTEVFTSTLAAEVGPEGGELLAPPDSPLAGVRLRVPAGAVSQRTRLTLDGIIAATPLGEAAAQVGPQFVVGPADTVFAAPVELTVPIDDDALGHFDQQPEDCKVWHLVGETWKRLERTDNTAHTVSVQLPSPGIVAAGVFVRPGLSACVNPRDCRIAAGAVVGNSCSSASGYCISELPRPSANPVEFNPGFIAKGRKLYYAHAPTAGQITVARYDLATGQTVVFAPLAVPGLSRVASRRIAVDDNGDAWLGLDQFGNVRFGENRAPFRFDVGAGQAGFGAVMVGGVAWRLVVTNGQMKITNGEVAHVMTDGTLADPESRPTENTSFVALQRGKAVVVNVQTGAVTQPFVDVTPNLNTQEIAASKVNDGFAAQMSFTGPNNIAWRTEAGNTATFGTSVKFLSFDADDVLHGVSLAPELRVFDPAGGLAVVPFVAPNGATSSDSRLLSIAFEAVPGRREFVFVANGSGTPRLRDFYLVQKAD